MSDKTEIKKDIEWLKEEVWKQDTVMDKGYIYTDDLISIINEVDEPEVLSSEWIKDKQLEWTSIFGSEYYVPTKELYGKIVPKQELPEIPQFVSGWIEETKEQSKSLVYAIARIYDKNGIDDSPSKEENRIFQWMEAYDNDDVFARAWLDGYTVEEEPKYNVMFKVKSLFGPVGIFLYKEVDEVLVGGNFKAYKPKEDKYRLTEYEIKKYDERFWPFRKPVEEMEE